MKVLLVTSMITYMPRNYTELFEALLSEVPEMIHGLVLLDNLDRKVLKSIFGLPLLGANQLFKGLCQNLLSLPFKERQKLFAHYQRPSYILPSMNDPRARELVLKEKIDFIINLRTRDIYKREILTAPTYGCLNIHHGLLPTYRGTMCDLYALSEGREAGFSIHQMSEKVDAGPIYRVVTVSNRREYDYFNYLKRTASLEGKALAELLRQFKVSLEQTGKIPSGLPNECSHKIYNKNPTRQKVQEMRKKGMIL